MTNSKVSNSVSALVISGLSLSLGGNQILREVSLEVRRGEFLSIVGPNGAGKTSLLRSVTGVVRDWSGEILVDGKPVRSCRPREFARLVSYVPQSDEMVFSFTVREFVSMGRYPWLAPLAGPGPGDLAAVEHALELTGTAELAGRDMRTLSGGERQKVFIAGALAQEAGTMLLDEPTTFMDPKHAEEILDILTDLNRSGVTVVMITHDINHAVHYAGSVAGLVGGRIAFCGSSEDLVKQDVLSSVYGKEFTLVRHPVSGKMMVLPGREKP